MMQKNKPYYSIVVPVYNEEGNAAALFEELKEQAQKLGKPFEIIFVDDDSTDKTLSELKSKSPITIIKLRRNSGQSSAMDAGIKQAAGQILITMDGDGQDDPANIPNMLEKLDKGFDVVCAWRHERQDSDSKRLLSWGWKHLRSYLVDDGVHDAGTQFRVYRREVFEDLDLYGELHRFIPALLKWQGFKVSEVKVNHRARMHGVSKYNWKRPMKGFSDLLYMWFWKKYSTRPQHLFGTLGFLSIFVGSIILLYMAYLKIFEFYQLSNKIWPLVGFFFVLLGVQFLTTGLLAANLVEMNKGKKYYIGEIIQN